MENGYEMAYVIFTISIVALVASYFVNKMDFKKHNKKSHH